MKAFIREVEEAGEPDLLSAALEARLARIEEMIGDLHDWMRAEQVSSLPGAYRQLYAHLMSNDFERRYASQVTRSVFQSIGSREAGDAEIHASAAREIEASIQKMSESLARIGDRENKAEPYILALVGPSGAGKTTLMYKLAVRAVLNFGLRVKIISCDTYKIGSVEGVQTIAEILSVPYGIAFQPSEVRELIAASEVDLIIVDTAGRSDRTSREELAEFIAAASPDEVHLVLSSTMSQRALQETAALFLGERITCVTFTKLDEAPSLGGLISAIQWMDLPVGYLSTGTEIPDDLLPSSDAPLGEWSVEGAPVADHDPEAKHV